MILASLWVLSLLLFLCLFFILNPFPSHHITLHLLLIILISVLIHSLFLLHLCLFYYFLSKFYPFSFFLLFPLFSYFLHAWHPRLITTQMWRTSQIRWRQWRWMTKKSKWKIWIFTRNSRWRSTTYNSLWLGVSLQSILSG